MLPRIVETVQKKKRDSGIKPLVVEKSVDEEAENLTLQLGGSLYSGEEPTTRPNMCVQSGSHGKKGLALAEIDYTKGEKTPIEDEIAAVDDSSKDGESGPKSCNCLDLFEDYKELERWVDQYYRLLTKLGL
ncbi:hypothetical protein IFM89_026315 [Coptis chinensis]|uniref:Uncharacterized protein n=1 Tax=Coptis chinensis TaxID=261450 RepID=A0A835I5L3_9MAGN|nr:hypothetical protein IFM89_026315 [Coptis chinensis]